MQSQGRDLSMEEILASIKKVIAEEKELRVSPAPAAEAEPEAGEGEGGEDEVLELNEPLAPPADLGPPLVEEPAAEASRQSLEQLKTVAATVPPPPPGNPLEDMVREMLRPILKQWLDEHLPQMIDDHVKREISRITGRQL